MQIRWIAISLLLTAGCALNASVDPRRDPAAVPGACPAPPSGSAGEFRHTRNSLFSSFGSPRHRGVDLIAVTTDDSQPLAGKIAYTAADIDISGEDVELFTCDGDDWRQLAVTRTGGDGRFEYPLTGNLRLAAGLHELYARVIGDGTGVRFVGYVAEPGDRVVVSDVDGTLTESENAIVNTVVFGDDLAHRPHAPHALHSSGHVVVYMTARGDQLTEVTRRWLAGHGFPRGPLRLSRKAITRPGEQALAFKTGALGALRVPVAAGIGNRGTDIIAYGRAGLPARRILIHLPDFVDEHGASPGEVAASRATGFRDYREVPGLIR